MKRLLAMLTVALVAVLSASPCSAVITYSFVNAENPPNSPLDIASQLYMDVSESSGMTLFTLRNTGPLDSTISAIFLEDSQSLLSSLFSIDNSDPGVDFVEVSPPGNLIGGFDVAVEAKATPPPAQNGIDPGESVGLYFTLSSGNFYQNVIHALDTGSMRVGLHVISLPDGNSDKFINNGRVVYTPVPGAMSLGGIALGCLALWRKRKNR